MEQKNIQVTKSSMPDYKEYINEIKELWDTHWLTNMGVKHKELELKLSQYLNVDNISLFTNGHLALESVIEAFDLKGEVITTPFTFVSTTHAIIRNGIEPVFCDIKFSDYTIDVEKIETLITDKTTAIIPVHVYGNLCDTDKINKIAQEYNLKVIYDAAHAFGESKGGIGVGNFGDASVFSFHATKVFNTIEGGAVTFKDSSIGEKLNLIKNFGIRGPEDVDMIGTNAKMNEFQAAMGICNLRSIDFEIEKRKFVFERYIFNLKNVNGIKIVEVENNIKSNYSYFPVIFDNFKKNRDEVYEELKRNNIISRKYFYPLTSELKCYESRFNLNNTPTAKCIADNVLTLPLYAELSLAEVDNICSIIKNMG